MTDQQKMLKYNFERGCATQEATDRGMTLEDYHFYRDQIGLPLFNVVGGFNQTEVNWLLWGDPEDLGQVIYTKCGKKEEEHDLTYLQARNRFDPPEGQQRYFIIRYHFKWVPYWLMPKEDEGSSSLS